MSDVIEALAGVTNVLLAAPSMGGSREVCSRLLTGDLDQPNVLFVSYTRGPADCVDQWAGTGAAATLAGITVGDTAAELDREDVETASVSTPSDLTGLGIEIGRVLSAWEGPTAVCFDSVTTMLQYVDFETAYEFLHTVTGQFHAADARAHFHIDPQAHETTTIDGITSLFDARVDAGEDLTVRTRDVVGERVSRPADG